MRARVGVARQRGWHPVAAATFERVAELSLARSPRARRVLVADALPDVGWLVDLGAQRLRHVPCPERVFRLHDAGLADDLPPVRSLDVVAHNLPVQLTSFVGRAAELAAVRDVLGRERLLTLTGSGGCGKTRLAVNAAAGLAHRWRDGTWWIELGPMAAGSGVVEVAAAAVSTLGIMVEPAGGPVRALMRHLRDQRLLLCLDNCEHLRDAAAELTDTLLRTCPDVSLLATSREPLGVAGETVWRVPSMVETEAVALFEDRAAHARAEFTIDAANEDVVRTICRRLDGIPLAVELAAAWSRTLAPAQIAAGLDDRFRLLSGAPRGVAARHRTLGASVAWSHDLLDPLDRAVFRRLAVFAGGLTIPAAVAVCAGGPVEPDDVLPAIGRLVDKSLVVAEHTDGHARYHLLETIREYARDQLERAVETAPTRDRHLDHFLDLAGTAEPRLLEAEQDDWLDQLEAEHDNLRSALRWGLARSNPDGGRRLAAALPSFWVLHGHTHEGIAHLLQALDAAEGDGSVLQTRLLVGLALVGASGRLDLVVDAAQRGLDLAISNDDHRNRGWCLALLAGVYIYVDSTKAQTLCVEARSHAEAAGDALAVDMSMVVEGLALTYRDRHQEVAPLLDATLERARRRRHRLFTAFVLLAQLQAALHTGHVRRAVGLGEEALRVAEPLADYFTVGAATSDLAWATGVAGDVAGARRIMESLVRLVEGSTEAVEAPFMAVTLGKLHLWDGDITGAVAWLERAARFAAPLVENQIAARALPALASAHRRLGASDTAREAAERALTLARKLDLPHVVSEAFDELGLLQAEEDGERAKDLHHQALALRAQHGLRTSYTNSLDLLARHEARAGSYAKATQLYAASDAARTLIGYPRPPVDQPDHDAAVADLRSRLGDDEFDAAWAEGAAMSLDDAVTYLGRTRGPRRRPTTGWASLTPTELDVVRFAVEGRTNAEIGSRLLMSRYTVKSHLAHVYAKLDVANRTELATLASTHLDEQRRTAGRASGAPDSPDRAQDRPPDR